MRRTLFTLGTTLACLICLLPQSSLAQQQSVAPAQTFPYLAGFPRTELKDVAFASPSVIDIDGDGKLDVLTADSAGCVYAWNSKGEPLPNYPLTTTGSCNVSARIGNPLAIADVDRDGELDILAGTRGIGTKPGELGKVFLWRASGELHPNWPKEMDWYAGGNGGAEIFGNTLANITGDADLEIIAGTSNNAKVADDSLNLHHLYAWSSSGASVSGYPADDFRTAGIYGNISAADLDNDGYAEVIAGRDHAYLHIHAGNGEYLPGWPVRTYLDPAKGDYKADPYIEFTYEPAVVGDIDGDGSKEIVIAGKVRDPLKGQEVTNTTVMVFDANGKRHAGWEIPPLGGPRTGSSFPPQQAPALADLDGNGTLEIVVAMFDGVIRAYREDGSTMWEYNYAQGRTLYGSEPVVGDITGDGSPDVVFGTYSPDGSAHDAARLIALDAQGRLIDGFPLTLDQEGTGGKRGIRAAPTLADLDGNGTVEIVVASQGGTLYVWDLPAPYAATTMAWPTGRGNNQRTGEAAPRVIFDPRDLPFKNHLPLLSDPVRGSDDPYPAAP